MAPRMSMVYYPHDGVEEAVAVARYAEHAGLDGFFCTDSAYRSDPWIALAAIAAATTRIRIGPSAVRMAPTQPLSVARALATLDEVSGGRVTGVIGVGTFGRTLPSGSTFSPLQFMREALPAVRTALDEERPAFDGTHYSFSITDMPITARPIQEHLPVVFGSSGGPRLIELAGEIADGVHFAPAYTEAACEYLVEHVRRGAERGGRDWRELDVAIGPILVCAEDGAAAKEAARIHSTFYLPLVPRPYFDAVNDRGLSYSEIEAVRDAWSAGDLRRATELVSPELASLLCVAGTPAECREQLRSTILKSEIEHLYVMFVDGTHVRLILGSAPDDVPTIREQLELFHREVMPALV